MGASPGEGGGVCAGGGVGRGGGGAVRLHVRRLSRESLHHALSGRLGWYGTQSL